MRWCFPCGNRICGSQASRRALQLLDVRCIRYFGLNRASYTYLLYAVAFGFTVVKCSHLYVIVGGEQSRKARVKAAGSLRDKGLQGASKGACNRRDGHFVGFGSVGSLGTLKSERVVSFRFEVGVWQRAHVDF